MKYLDYPELEGLSRALTFESAECKVFTRIEAYSCKAVKRERQLFKSLESHYLQSASLSPPNHVDEVLASPFGRLDQSHARKTLYLLIATLNGAFPDHDFSGVDPADFRKETSPDSVLNSLGTTLQSLRSNSDAPRSFSSFPSSYDEERNPSVAMPGAINHPQLSSVLDDIMCITECEVYTFHPDADSDPHASAEPEEEGFSMDDERYADDESGSNDDDDDDGMDTRMTTPRQRRSYTSYGGQGDDEDAAMDDTPMFDEELLGDGFTPVHSRVSSTVTTPRTPSSARARAGDFFSLRKSVASSSSKLAYGGVAASAPSGGGGGLQGRPSERSYDSIYSDDNALFDDLDDGPGLHGLLWATYAFFYNRKLKRILFVSVWSRRNLAGPVSYSFSPPSYPTYSRSSESAVPPLSIDQAITSSHGTGGQQKATLQPSAAKVAAAATTAVNPIHQRAVSGGKKRGRDLSASPAPSSLSPFPHDSPQGRRGRPEATSSTASTSHDSALKSAVGGGAQARVLSGKLAPTVSASPLRIASTSSSFASDEPVEQSSSAPNVRVTSRSAPAAKAGGMLSSGHGSTTSSGNVYTGRPPVVLSSSPSTSSSSSSKRGGDHGRSNDSRVTREDAQIVGHTVGGSGLQRHSLDHSARKHRKVNSPTT